MGRRRRLLTLGRDTLVLLAITAVLLAVIELALRAGGFEYDAHNPIVFSLPWGGVEHRFHPYWFWEPRPGVQVANCDGEHINAAGFRGPERPHAHPPDKLRIVTLGDSSTFGAGVCGDKPIRRCWSGSCPGSRFSTLG